jgi:hypothetical protein
VSRCEVKEVERSLLAMGRAGDAGAQVLLGAIALEIKGTRPRVAETMWRPAVAAHGKPFDYEALQARES